MPDSYRSYVIRIRRPDEGGPGIRLDLEDLLGGGRVAMTGDEARSLSDRLAAMLGAAGRPNPPEAASERVLDADPDEECRP